MTGTREREDVALRHFLLAIAYDGAGFHGWQRQRDARSVQGELEATLGRILSQPVRVRGAGRTDAGVHALDQKAAFSARTRLRAPDVLRALNALLPEEVRVTAAEECPEPVDPRRAAWRKTYVYQLHVGPLLPPQRRFHYHWAGRSLDVAAMRRAARLLEGEHDFTSFARKESTRRGPRGPVRRLFAVRVRRVPQGVRLFFSGSGFLYNMVRTLAAALLDVGRGRQEPGAVAAMLAARDRERAPATLPAHGLWLWRVDLRMPGEPAAQDAPRRRSDAASTALAAPGAA